MRPAPGDQVFPVLICPKSWQASGVVELSVRLQVQGPHDATPQLLRHEDIPPGHTPRAAITFRQGTEVRKTLPDISLTPEC